MMRSKYWPVYKNSKPFWVCFAAAQLSFITTLWLPYQGEEAVYTITSMEMAFRGEWISPIFYGENYGRPPLLNWILIPLGHYFGWDNILIISRLVTAIATLLTSLLLVGLGSRLFPQRNLGLLAALIYMSGDVLFRRGWLAYADPLLSLFVLGAFVALWIAVEEKKNTFLALAVLSLIASFLTKALTGYLFYGIAVGVFFTRREYRKFLLNPTAILLQGIGLLFPLIWNIWISNGAHGSVMVNDILARLNLNNLVSYCLKVTLFPLDTFVRWLPVSGVILYFWIKEKKRSSFFKILKQEKILPIVWITILNYLPYWFSPEFHTRYLLPLYPLLSFLMAYLILEIRTEKIKLVLVWISIAILLRYLIGIFGFPYYQHHYRGNYQAVAKDILNITKNKPLFTSSSSAVGLSVTAYIDMAKMPNSVLTYPKAYWQGYLITDSSDIPNTQIVKTYQMGSHKLYLISNLYL